MKKHKVRGIDVKKLLSNRDRVRSAAIIVATVVTGVTLVYLTRAATPFAAIEAESGVLGGTAQKVANDSASGKTTIRFGRTSTGTSNYNAVLSQLLASEFRNADNDSSPFINTPSAGLENQASLYGSRADYVNTSLAPYNWDVNTNSSNEGIFRTSCEFSHFSYDDPIIYPGAQDGVKKAHLHMFWGNTHVNAFSTYDTILNTGGSTCNGGELNRTGYWAPALIDQNGNARVPERVLIYYKSFNSSPGSAVGSTEIYPPNMQIVADNAVNNKGVGDNPYATFRCVTQYNGYITYSKNTIPNCKNTAATNGGDGRLEMNIKYAQCWNGQDPSNYKVNLAEPLYNWYSGRCPASHPRMLPNLEYRIHYPVAIGEDTSKWFLSSDVDRASATINVPRGSTAHADWFGGWNKEINKTWVALCNNTPRADCGEGYLGGNFYTQTQFKALKYRKEYKGYKGNFYMPGDKIFAAMCGSGKSITKPEDIAYCR